MKNEFGAELEKVKGKYVTSRRKTTKTKLMHNLLLELLVKSINICNLIMIPCYAWYVFEDFLIE